MYLRLNRSIDEPSPYYYIPINSINYVSMPIVILRGIHVCIHMFHALSREEPTPHPKTAVLMGEHGGTVTTKKMET
jgi:hypothetical protein